MARFAVIGLGEAGAAIARDLGAAGASVRGFDPAVASVDGVKVAASGPDAVRGADAVLSVNSARVAEDVAASVAGALDPARFSRTSTPLRRAPSARSPRSSSATAGRASPTSR